MNKGKWFVRVASLVILMGFFLPSVLVSCSGGFIEANQAFSLSDLASYAKQSALYILPIVVIATAILTFLKAKNTTQSIAYFWGQVGLVAVGLISVIGSLITVYNQVQGGSYGLFKVNLSFGAFVLIGGIAVMIVGLVMEWKVQKQTQEEGARVPIRNGDLFHQDVQLMGAPQIPIQDPVSSSGAYLELISGNLSTRMFPLHGDNFVIGRSSNSHLRLPDPAVSRIHVCLRNAQSMWFLQDQQSTGGTLVNGRETDAVRLNNGDEITIGPFQFIFHSGY